MTTTKRSDSWRSALTLLVAALLLWPAMALALPTCTTTSAVTLCGDTTAYPSSGDCDGDGFTNAQECSGITTDGPSSKPIAGCTSTTCSADGFDPTKPDLFYLVSSADGADLAETVPGTIGADGAPENSLLFAALASDPNALKVYANGLKVRTHLLKKADCGNDRLIKGTGVTVDLGSPLGVWEYGVRAARIVESYDAAAEAGFIGSTPQSKPNDMYVGSTIYTQRIKANVDKNCATVAKGKCNVKGTLPLITNAVNNDTIVNYYILQVVSHEMGHGSMLAGTTAASYYHYAKSGTVMDPAATFSRGIYTIPTTYDS
ncbi:MAG: hypothetical protein ACYC9I_13115, partial [Desulfuromonadales bacterium]